MSTKREPKTPIVHKCSCGCDTETRNAFAPGHDNRFYGQVIRGERPAEQLEAFPGLMRKWAGRQAKEAIAALRQSGADEVAGALASEIAAEPKSDMWTEDQPNQTAALIVEPTFGHDIAPTLGATEIKDGRWWYKVRAIRPLSDGRYEVDWTAKNGGARTTRVAADKLR